MNIGPREQRKRLVMGAVMSAVAIITAGALIFFGLSRWWRAGVFFLFWFAALGFFQAKEKT